MEQKRFTGLLDMINGGGMGAEGNEFKGGGLLSDIGNALFQPYGTRRRQQGMEDTRPKMRPPSLMTGGVMTGPDPEPLPTRLRPRARPTQGAPAPMSQEDMLTQMRSQLASGNNTPTTPGPMMPGGPTPPMPMQPAPQMQGDQQSAMLEQMRAQLASNPTTPQQPGPMMPGGPQPPMPMEQALAQLDQALSPGERQTLQALPPEQRMGLIQRMIQTRQQGGM